jgi:alpha-tubulin suppressor-like RCC1 family protein
LQRDGTVWCWGGGWGTQDLSEPDNESPRLVPEFGSDVAALVGGEGGICALYSTGTGICIGSVFGVVMHGGSAPAVPIGVPALDGARAVAIGDRHVCAVGSDDALRCWGANDLGQLGDGTFVAHTTPALASSLDGGRAAILQIAAGEGVTCASFDDGAVRCVGSDDHGALGDGSALSIAAVPVSLAAGTSLTSYQSAINTTAFAVQTDGSVVAWGVLPSVVLPAGGPALQAAVPVPVAAPPAEPATEQASITYDSACLLGSDGAVRCLQSSAPATFAVVSGLASGVVDLNGNCAALATGGVRCGIAHGYNPSGSASSGDVAGLANGAAGACLLRPDGTVECWPAFNLNYMTPAQQVQDLGGPAIAIAVGDEGCALRDDGAVLCWPIDQSDDVPSAQFVQLPVAAYGITAASGMVCGRGTCMSDSTHGHVCAWTAAGDLYCWGDNTFGQLGDGTTVVRTGFVRATAPGGPVLSASAGDRQTCAVRAADKRLICWGWNGAGELGNGTGGPRATAATVALP